MSLEVSFRHMKPREEIRRRATALYGKLERFLDPSAEGSLVISFEHSVPAAEAHISAWGQVFKAESDDADLRTSIDRIFHTLENSLRRAKTRRVDAWQKGSGREDGFVAPDDELDDA